MSVSGIRDTERRLSGRSPSAEEQHEVSDEELYAGIPEQYRPPVGLAAGIIELAPDSDAPHSREALAAFGL
jgi:hypothetical protein